MKIFPTRGFKQLRILLSACMGLVLLGFLSNARAIDRILEVHGSEQAAITLTPYWAILEDKDGRLRIDDLLHPEIAARFQTHPKHSAALEFGFTKSSYWLRLDLTNRGEQVAMRYLVIDYAMLTRIDYFHVVGNTLQEKGTTGIDQKFSTRAFPSRSFVFPIEVEPHSDKTFYLRVQAIDSMVIPAKLWQPKEYRAYERNDYMVHAVYLGLLLSMILFNLMLYVGGLRGKIYLLYVGYGSALLLTVLGFTGLGKQYLWPDLTWQSNVLLVSAFGIALAFLLSFMRYMIGTSTLIPRLDPILKLFVRVLCVIPFFLLISLQTFIQVTAMFYFFVGLVTLFISVLCAYKRQRSAYFFLAGFFALMLGCSLVIGRALGLLEGNSLTENGIQLGSACEMLILALALADRYNILRKEKANMQLESLNAKEKLVLSMRELEKELEARVNERNQQLNTAIEGLKKTQLELVQTAKLAALGSLVAAVSHELNTPLGNAVMAASTIDDATRGLHNDIESGRLRKSSLESYVQLVAPLANLILKSCRRAADLVISFKRVAVDQGSEKRRHFDLRTVLNDHVAAISPSLVHHPMSIGLSVDANIVCDSYPGQLGQVIVNLVQNAMVHAFPGRSSGNLMISSERRGDCAILRFCDDGCGISEEALPHIFEPFFTTKLGQGGSGLGLSIAMNIVTDVLGGTMVAESTFGKGTCFELTFPLVAPSKPTHGAQIERDESGA